MKGKNEDKKCKRNLRGFKRERGRASGDFLQANLPWIFGKRDSVTQRQGNGPAARGCWQNSEPHITW